MSREELPTNYAQAIYKMALEEWTSWLDAVRQRFLEDTAAAEFLISGEGSPAEKQQRLQAVLPKESSPKFQQFVGYLVDKRDLYALDEIIGSFERIVELGAGREVAYVASALELSDEDRTNIQESLRRRFGAGLDCEFSVDPSLLGGVQVRVGDTFIDGTVAGRLESLREQLVSR